MTAVLELEEVTRVYGSGRAAVRALDGVSLQVGPGELVAVMGPSGSGKSTLLNLAGGLDRPTAGRVVVDGTDLGALDRRRLAALRRRRVGYVFQDLNLLPGLTAAENVALPLELDGAGTRQARAEALAALDLVGLAGRAAAFPDQLSGGERQQVAIARAVAGRRVLLLADEPTGALDSHSTEDVLHLFDTLSVAGRTIVVITHEDEVAGHAKRVLRMRDGLIESDVRHADVRSLPPRYRDRSAA
jgi:putative ABC transport system ATP-binding protein